MNHVKGLVTSNTHVQYESSITSGKKVKVFDHASNAAVDADRDYDISFPDIRPALLKIVHMYQEKRISLDQDDEIFVEKD